jgi:hypothetical protein
MQNYRGFVIKWWAGLAAMTMASAASAQFVIVYGAPGWDETTRTGYQASVVAVLPGSSAGNGVGVGRGSVYSASDGTYLGQRAIRWDALGNAAELGNFGTSGDGFTISEAHAINSAGTTVGIANRYSLGVFLGIRAVRWDASGTAATELGNLGTNSSGVTGSNANAINGAGVAVGEATKWNGDTSLGSRAVRWDPSGSATELGNLGASATGFTQNHAWDVNEVGTAVGYGNKYIAGIDRGLRAVRWDAPGTAATELDNLGTKSNGNTTSVAYAVNAAGTAVGYAEKYGNGGAAYFGERAVRWDGSGSAATELGNISDNLGFTNSHANAINDAGTAVGYGQKWAGGADLGLRAVRWNASGISATELANLGTDNNGFTASIANAINTDGIAVGESYKYIGGMFAGHRAVLWQPDGTVLDLNNVIAPDGLWSLIEARGISDTNWITGYGTFDPDGPGPLKGYSRAFLLNLSVVPEPTSVSFLAVAALALRRRRRR